MSPALWAGMLAALAAVDLVLAAPVSARRLPALARTADGAVRGPLAWALGALVRVYRAGWSGRNAGCCRFEPSCSAYALSAVRRHGGVIGGLLAARRLLRCQPLSAGGYDPVPGGPPPGRRPPLAEPAGAEPAGVRPVGVRPVGGAAERHVQRPERGEPPRRGWRGEAGGSRDRAARGQAGRARADHRHGSASLHRGTRSEIVGSRRGTRV